MEFLKPTDWENIKRNNIAFYPVTVNTDNPIPDNLDIPDDIIPSQEQETSYSFLPGTPLSYFQSAVKKPISNNSGNTDPTPLASLPDGSENIDDIL